jgi:putative DNA-invertase from lambdoid prophage Rac
VIEEGVSGSVPVEDRPVGGQLFATLHRGDIVIAAKLDRLFRSALDALKVVESLKTRGVKLHLPMRCVCALLDFPRLASSGG